MIYRLFIILVFITLLAAKCEYECEPCVSDTIYVKEIIYDTVTIYYPIHDTVYIPGKVIYDTIIEPCPDDPMDYIVGFLGGEPFYFDGEWTPLVDDVEFQVNDSVYFNLSKEIIEIPDPPDTVYGEPTKTYNWSSFEDFGRAVEGSGSITLQDGMVHFTSSGKRAELHGTRNFLGVGEGDVAYFGWTERYDAAPKHQYTTFQWRDQDNPYTGCCVMQFNMASSYGGLGTVNGLIARIKEGYTGQGKIVPNLQTGVTYKFVVGIYFSKGSDGWFTAWAGENIDYDNPVYEFHGATMYSFADMGTDIEPCDSPDVDHDIWNSPQLRFGIYQWRTVGYVDKWMGALKINVGEQGETAFNKVK